MARPVTTTQPNGKGADLAAKAVLEATVAGDEATCEKYGISRRTLFRWRKALGRGKPRAPLDNLAQSVTEKRVELEGDWAAEIPKALQAAVAFLLRSAEPGGADPKDPDAIHAVAGAMKMLSEVSATWKLLDVRIRRATGQAGQTTGPVASGGTVVQLRRSEAVAAE